MTGKLVVTKEYEKCENENQEVYKRENETFYKKGLDIKLQNRSAQSIKVISPKYRHEIYVAVKAE